MKEAISVCIPTRNRETMLVQALESILAQSYRPLRILIGDDSDTPVSQNNLESLTNDQQVIIDYKHNQPKKGQAANVNDLFSRVETRWLILLHDDDLLLPHAISNLTSTTVENGSAKMIFGKQRLLSNDGVDLGDRAARDLNEAYFRTESNLGLQNLPLTSALLRQIPNNGYLIDSCLAKEIGYRPRNIVGDACDTDFSIRVGAKLKPMELIFINEHTAAYRLSNTSIARGGGSMTASFMFDFIESLAVEPDNQPAKKIALQNYARGAIREHWHRKNFSRSLTILKNASALNISYWSRIKDLGWIAAKSVTNIFHKRV